MLRAMFLAIMLLSSASAPAWAQMTAVTTTQDTDETSQMVAEILRSGDAMHTEPLIRDLVARLSNDGVRSILLEQLGQNAAMDLPDAATDLGTIQNAQLFIQEIRARLASFILAVPAIPREIAKPIDNFIDGRPASKLWLILFGTLVMIAAGATAEFIFVRLTHKTRAKILNAEPRRPIARLLFPAARMMINLTGLLVFLAVTMIAFFSMYQGHEPTRLVVTAYLGAIVMARAIGMIFQCILAPKAPNLRLAGFSDKDAKFSYNRGLFLAWVVSFALATTSLLSLFGINDDARLLLNMIIGIFIVGTIVSLLLGSRTSISNDILGSDPDISPARRAFATAWPIITSVLVVLLFPLMVVVNLAGLHLPPGTGIVTILMVITLPHLDAAIGRAAHFRMREKDRSQEFKVVVFQALRILLITFAFFILTRLWGIDIGEVARENIGGRLAGALLDTGATALVAYVLWQIVRIWVERKLEEEKVAGGDGADGNEGGQGGSRLSTILPLIRSTLQITIVVLATLIILSGLGVDIGPLLAGAGVIGLAVGFGAQTLVRDIVSGAFFLLDDAFRVDEYIDVGSVKGTVEKISIRSIRLRHHRGLLHTIPFGEISHLTNFSRDWVIMKLEFRLTYDTDVNKVKKIFKKIGKDMLAHKELGDGFLEPFKSQGVKRMEESAMIVGAKFMTKPGAQFMIRKELYSRVQKAFAENDIHFAHKRVAVDLPEGFDATTEQGKTLVDAAAAAIAAQEEEESSGPQSKPA